MATDEKSFSLTEPQGSQRKDKDLVFFFGMLFSAVSASLREPVSDGSDQDIFSILDIRIAELPFCGPDGASAFSEGTVSPRAIVLYSNGALRLYKILFGCYIMFVVLSSNLAILICLAGPSTTAGAAYGLYQNQIW
jgi:hypothetical protein